MDMVFALLYYLLLIYCLVSFFWLAFSIIRDNRIYKRVLEEEAERFERGNYYE